MNSSPTPPSNGKVFVTVKRYGGGGPEYDELKVFSSKEQAEKYCDDNEGQYHYAVEELELQ